MLGSASLGRCGPDQSAPNEPGNQDRSGTSEVEDRVKGRHVVGVHPPLDLLPGAEVEHARHSRLEVHPGPLGTHIAQCTDVLVVTEHIVLPYGEPEFAESAEPGDELVETADLSRHRVPTGHVPDNVLGD